MATVFEKILIATDGSLNNKAAVEMALNLARQCGSSIYVLNVIDMVIFDRAAPATIPKVNDLLQMLKDEGKRAVDEVKQRAPDLNIKTFVITGRPAQEITKFASENKVDLIVVGTHGMGCVERVLIGSVADKVIRTADLPVLIVKPHPGSSAALSG
jgi:nucleotide-binding universal stress UspA family protein